MFHGVIGRNIQAGDFAIWIRKEAPRACSKILETGANTDHQIRFGTN